MFNCFFNDDSKQDAETTASHSKNMLKLLQQRNILNKTSSTIWYNTDGCAEKYRCATALYLLSMLYHAHEIIIYCDVVSPGHGKTFVDGINATEKIILSMLMKIVQLPNAAAKNYQVVIHTSSENADISL